MTQLIAPDLIDPNPWQPRATLAGVGDKDVEELIDSIVEQGLLQNPRVRPHPKRKGRYQLVFGHRRLTAWKIARSGEPIPVEVVELADLQMYQQGAAENGPGEIRKDLGPIETARAIQRGIDDFGLTQLEAGRPFGFKTQGAVANLLNLLNLPETLQTSVDNRELPQRHARQLERMAVIAPKPVEALAKKIATAPPAKRDDVLDQGLSDILQRYGRDLENAPFDLEWPPKPIPLNGQASPDGPVELVACIGCPFHFRRDEYDHYCALTACYDLKVEHFAAIQLQTAVKDSGIPAVGPKEKASPIANLQEGAIRKLLLAGPARPELGLRLTIADHSHYGIQQALGVERVQLVSLHPEAVKAFLESGERVATPKPKPGTPAAKKSAATRQKEEAERAERAEGRARKLHTIQDVIWLVKHTTPIVASQLTISGHVLRYVTERLMEGRGGRLAQEFPGLEDWVDALQEQASTLHGKDADALRRQYLVADEILQHAFGYGLQYQLKDDFGEVWKSVRNDVHKLATQTGEGSRLHIDIGFGAKLPPGWDRPPVHQTNHNCWDCNKFAGNTRITKRNQDEGWTFTSTPAKSKADEETVSHVRCPACSKKAAGVAKSSKDKGKGKR